MKDKIQLVDVTLRDGGFTCDFDWPMNFAQEYYNLMSKLGVKYVEMLKDEPVIKKEISQGLFPFKGCLINHLPGSQAMGWQK